MKTETEKNPKNKKFGIYGGINGQLQFTGKEIYHYNGVCGPEGKRQEWVICDVYETYKKDIAINLKTASIWQGYSPDRSGKICKSLEECKELLKDFGFAGEGAEEVLSFIEDLKLLPDKIDYPVVKYAVEINDSNGSRLISDPNDLTRPNWEIDPNLYTIGKDGELLFDESEYVFCRAVVNTNNNWSIEEEEQSIMSWKRPIKMACKYSIKEVIVGYKHGMN